MRNIKKVIFNIVHEGKIDEHCKKSYSQTGEDLIIDFIFKAIKIKTPTFIDIGAHHPKYINNTYIFYKRGSRGVNIEPNPALIGYFYKKRKKDINLNIAIGSGKSGYTDFYIMSASTMSTLSAEEALRLENESSITKMKIINKIKVKVDTIENVLRKCFKGRFPDLLNLDIEGYELDILKSIDYTNNGPKVICVETISYSEKGKEVKSKEIIEYLLNQGYILFADTYINSIFVRASAWKARFDTK